MFPIDRLPLTLALLLGVSACSTVDPATPPVPDDDTPWSPSETDWPGRGEDSESTDDTDLATDSEVDEDTDLTTDSEVDEDTDLATDSEVLADTDSPVDTAPDPVDPPIPTDLDGDGVLDAADCAPNDPARFPGASEVPYDAIDQDCSGADLIDVDRDGFASTQAGGTDCDDASASRFPGASEVPYDSIDQDCSGADLVDVDRDGFASTQAGGTDCDDASASRFPGANEVPYDAIDQDCSGADLVDVDRDGFASTQAGGTDCNDNNPSRNPGAVDVPYDNLDQDCSGADLIDVDGDGYVGRPAGGDDCDDRSAGRNPGAIEIPYDTIDQDCSGADLIDVDGDGFASTQAGGADCDDRNAARNPNATEVPYDSVDQDCSGADLVDVDRDGVASTAVGGGDCDDLDPGRSPQVAEVCGNGLDEDCDPTALVCGWSQNANVWEADLELVGSVDWQLLGTSLLGAESVDGDDRTELAIGAPGWESNNGAVFVLSIDELTTNPAVIDQAPLVLRGHDAGGVGAAISALDHDRNGVVDLAISAPLALVNGTPHGAVYRQPSGYTGARHLRNTWVNGGSVFLAGTGETDLGVSLASGDVHGTGRPLLYAVGESTAHAGLVTILPAAHVAGTTSVGAAPTGGVPLFAFAPHSTLRARTVASGSDLGGTFADELAIVVNDETLGQVEVMVVSQQTTSSTLNLLSPTLPTRVKRILIATGFSNARPQLAMVPSVTDAAAGNDLVIGLPCAQMGCFDGGQVWVLPGDYDGWPSSMTADRIVNQLGGVHLYSSNPGDRLGSSVGYPGDVDGDGHADLLVGSSGANGDVGAAYLLYGPVPAGSWNVGQVGTRNLPGVRIDGVQADGQFGWALTTLGDTNDDGYDDFALSAPTATSLVGDDGSGRVYVFLGRGD